MQRRADDIDIERVYNEVIAGRYRVLVDRLWPRGVSKQAARLDEWLRDIAPTTELRRWYAHETAKYAEFARRYHDELDRPPASDAVRHLREVAHTRPTALVTATRDVDHSGARVLRDHLSSSPGPTGSGAGP